MDAYAAFPPDPQSVAAARRFVSHVLAACGCEGSEDIAVLLVSELVTNAIRHAGGSRCDLTLHLSDGVLRVEVRDESPRPPARRAPGPDDTSGRGLVLIDSLAAQWGTQPGPGRGKVVWFELPAV